MPTLNEMVFGVDWGLRNLLTVVRGDGKLWGQIQLRENPDPEALASSLIAALPPHSIVVVEALRGVRKHIKVTPTYLPFLKFQAALKRLAPNKNIKVVTVRPAHTSQTCPRCQFQSPLNRLLNTFKCQKCGYVANADYVGALNIALRFLWERRGKPRRGRRRGLSRRKSAARSHR
jgi:ribosomal protein S27AE